MLSEEDKKEIKEMIDEVMMDWTLKIPSVISNLVKESAKKVKMYMEYIKKNNYLKTTHAELVAKIIQEVESEHPGKPYEDILGLADPIVKERLKTLSQFTYDKPEKPQDLTYKGELGEL